MRWCFSILRDRLGSRDSKRSAIRSTTLGAENLNRMCVSLVMRFYPLPFRSSMSLLPALRSAQRSALAQRSTQRSALPWSPSCAYHVLSRLQPHGLSADETHRLLSAAMVHRALAVDTVRGIVVPDRIPMLTFQELEGMPVFLMEWNRFSPLRPLYLVRSVVTSANADAAAELFLLRDPWVRLIIRIRARQDKNDENAGSDNNWSA